MSTWLGLLPLEIQDVKELIEPAGEVRKNETVVGTVSEDLKKIWTLRQMLAKQAEHLEVDFKFTQAASSPHLDNPERGKIDELKSKSKALELIFWIGVLDENDLWGYPGHMSVRTGWQLVSYQRDEPPFPFNLFKGLTGDE